MKPYNDETKELYDRAFQLLERSMEILQEAYVAHCKATGRDDLLEQHYIDMEHNLKKDETI